jgi:DNA-binding NarL/FixJ family response regulator
VGLLRHRLQPGPSPHREGRGAWRMFIRAAVWDPLPLFCRGLLALLDAAGFDVEVPDDLMSWVSCDGLKILLMTLATPVDWQLLTSLKPARSDLAVIAMLADHNLTSYVRAAYAGAVSAIPRCAEPSLVQRTFEAAVDGRSLLPVAALRAITAGASNGEVGSTSPSEEERNWLRQLAQGSSVADLAKHAGYSERMMFRLLHALYVKLQAPNRTVALIRARDEGWL